MTMERPKTGNEKRVFLPQVYDAFLWLCALCLHVFFREIQTRASYRVPKQGPLIIVAGPHANQFVDSIILMRVLKANAHRRVSFLIAEKSMREPYIGTLAGLCGSLPVARAKDHVQPGEGKIYFSDPDNDPTLIRGLGTDFTAAMYMRGGTIVFPRVGKQGPPTATIAEILGKDLLRLKKAADLPSEIADLMRGTKHGSITGVPHKVAPYIDQSKVFDTASNHLVQGGCIGIFPEGGSHDRTDLLPLKAGVSIMALNTLALDPKCGLTIIPCGMNYFHAHKFRSRAVVEFGPAIHVHPDQVEAYKAGGSQRRNAVGSLLETINEGLIAVTQASPDYETMMLIQATRRLYNPIGKKLPLSAVVEVNRRLIKGYNRFRDEPRVTELKQNVLKYNRRLRNLGIKDHQIEWGDFQKRPWWLTLGTLVYRLAELVLLTLGTFPGLLLFWPVFVTSKIISVRKRKKALANSVVKLRGRDVVGTWKILVGMGLTPALYLWYTAILTLWLHYNRNDGSLTRLVPRWMRANTYVSDTLSLRMFAASCIVLLISVSFAALRIGEIGMDIVKSIPPLLVALNPFTSTTFGSVRAHRQALAAEVADVVNTFGPQIFQNFDRDRIIPDPYKKKEAYQSNLKRMEKERSTARDGRERSLSAGLDVSTAFQFTPISERYNDASDTWRAKDALQERGRDGSSVFGSDVGTGSTDHLKHITR